jgi:hypothetical protein
MAKKLPDNVFGDNPLRPTGPASFEAPAAAPVEPASAPAVSLAPVPPAPPVEKPKSVRASAEPVATGKTVKATAYLPLELMHALEDEVFERRRAGERHLTLAELHREIVGDWVARRQRRQRPSAASLG